MTGRLSLKTLGTVTTAKTPSYARADLKPGVLHFGVGNFHRAHQAVYLDALFNMGEDHDWAIIGAGVMPQDAPVREILQSQDYLSTIVEQSAQHSAAKVTGAMIDYLPIGDGEKILAQLCDPRIRIVSLTVTEGGYFLDGASGAFDAQRAEIQLDAAAPHAPQTVFGLIAAGLRRRRALGLAPFTIMSCDNIPHNGEVTKAAIIGVAQLWDRDFADWIASEVAFPNAMVDRITPATGGSERMVVLRDYMIQDTWPVFCEDFSQWVLEDAFCAGRPALEKVGVTFVSDVSTYENLKIRVLNGGHAVLSYPAGLMGLEFAHEAMANEVIRGFLRKVTVDEILPTTPAPPGVDARRYARQIEERFANPKIQDTVRRLCLDGSNRQPKFIVPSIRDRLEAGAGVSGLALESALWCRYCFGEDESGAKIAPNDPNWARLQEAARAAKENPLQWLAMKDIYGDVAEAEPFILAFSSSLRALWAEGAEAVLRNYLSKG